MNVEHYIKEYKKEIEFEGRYASFDYCYRYFRLLSGDEIRADLEKSCNILAFYLASWGMLRGSGFLLQKSVFYYKEAVLYISELEKTLWEIDVDTYSESNINTILTIYSDVKQLIVPEKTRDLTVVTKILLGVLGFVPAFDQYFCAAAKDWCGDGSNKCGFSRFNKEALLSIFEFYKHNRDCIDRFSNDIKVKSFDGCGLPNLYYPKAKVIDMWGFCRGYEIEQVKKQKKKLKKSKLL